ncbi:MAG: nickel-dependent hydrogenase large subunit [Candidatus Bipolaricaulia bacterium]
MTTREVTMRFEVPEVYRLVVQADGDGVIREARVEGEFVSRQIGTLVKTRYADPHKALYVVERLCGACSHAHTLAFAGAVERALGIRIPARAEAIRTLGAELERIQSHAFSLSEITTAARCQDLERSLWGAWQEVTAILVEISGSRIHYGLNGIGGLARDVPSAALRRARSVLASLRRSVQALRGGFERELGKSLAGLGVWSSRDGDLPGTGPNQRASGSSRDIRREEPYLLYEELPFDVPVREEGDSLARACVRLEEMIQSCGLAERILASVPAGAIQAESVDPVPDATFVGRMSVEAPRGCDRHDVTMTREGEVKEFAIRVPTEDSIVGVASALIGVREADARLVVASFDLCMSCFGGT